MVQADRELLSRARRHAAQRGVSLAQLVREALEREVGAGPPRESRLIGAFDSGEDHDVGRESGETGRMPPRSWRS